MPEIVLAGMRLSDCPKPYTPSSAVICHGCGVEVWFSDLTARQIKAEHGTLEGVKSMCMECIRPLLPRAEAQRPSGETLTDLKQRGLDDDAIDRFLDRFKKGDY
jgi:transposase